MDQIFVPTTAVNRIVDTELSKFIQLGPSIVRVPKGMLRKDVRYFVDDEGEIVRSAWINKGLAHIFNSRRSHLNNSVKLKELEKAKAVVDSHINLLIKNGILKDKQGPGAMSFSQSNENVPPGCLYITKRSYEVLCQANERWRNTRTVIATRFPNLGIGTTQELKLIVGRERGNYGPDSLFYRAPELRDLLEDLVVEEQNIHFLMDSFYLNPKVLKDSMEGDGDGDSVYIVAHRKGSPIFEVLDLTREPGEISQEDVDQMFKKADRIERKQTAKYLPRYLDNQLIGPITYIIRWDLKLELPKHKDSPHPMNSAWQVVGPKSLPWVEFSMDMRKGEFTEQEIKQKMAWVARRNSEIQQAKANGSWFARTVTNSHIEDISGFLQRFRTLQSYVNSMTQP